MHVQLASSSYAVQDPRSGNSASPLPGGASLPYELITNGPHGHTRVQFNFSHVCLKAWLLNNSRSR